MNRNESDSGYRRWLWIANANLERFALIVFYVYIITVVILEVFRRFVLNDSSLWASQSAMYVFIYMSWIGMSWAAYKRAHIRMNLLYEFVSDRHKTYLYVVSDVAMIAFGLFTIRYMYDVIEASLRFSRDINVMSINQAVFQMAIVIGMMIFVFRTLQRLYGDVKAIQNDEAPYEGGGLFEFGGEE